MITYQCSACGQELESPEDLQGHKENCPHCGAVNDVPIVAAEDEAASQSSTCEADAAAPQERVATAVLAEPAAQGLKLRFRRPAFTYLRSGLGLFLIVGFLLPWLDISCNNATIMNPSAFNLVTGVPDSKTKGMIRTIDEFGKSIGGDSGKKSAAGEFSFWDGPGGSSNKQDESGKDGKMVVARICICFYGFLLFPAIVVMSVVLLSGQFNSSPNDPPWDQTVQKLVLILAVLAVIPVLLFGILTKPSELPPMIDFSLDWGFYLTIFTLAGLAATIVIGKTKPAR